MTDLALFLPPKGVKLETYREVISGASAAYNVKRDTPTIAEIANYCRPNIRASTITKIVASSEFKKLMSSRGYSFEKAHTLTPEQYFAVSIITNASDRRPLSAKLKSAGVTYAQYRGWLKQPIFREYISSVSEDMLGEHVQDVHTRVVERASSGDIQAIKLYYELTGRHDPNRQQMLDLQNVVRLLLEIITRYVTDTRTLTLINTDIEAVLSGRPVSAIDQFDIGRIANNTIKSELIPATTIASSTVDEDLAEMGLNLDA